MRPDLNVTEISLLRFDCGQQQQLQTMRDPNLVIKTLQNQTHIDKKTDRTLPTSPLCVEALQTFHISGL